MESHADLHETDDERSSGVIECPDVRKRKAADEESNALKRIRSEESCSTTEHSVVESQTVSETDTVEHTIDLEEPPTVGESGAREHPSQRDETARGDAVVVTEEGESGAEEPLTQNDEMAREEVATTVEESPADGETESEELLTRDNVTAREEVATVVEEAPTVQLRIPAQDRVSEVNVVDGSPTVGESM